MAAKAMYLNLKYFNYIDLNVLNNKNNKHMRHMFTHQRFSFVFRRHAENFFDIAVDTEISNVHETNFYFGFINYFQHFSAIPIGIQIIEAKTLNTYFNLV